MHVCKGVPEFLEMLQPRPLRSLISLEIHTSQLCYHAKCGPSRSNSMNSMSVIMEIHQKNIDPHVPLSTAHAVTETDRLIGYQRLPISDLGQ